MHPRGWSPEVSDCAGEVVRHVRLHAQSRGVCPGGHMGAGGKAWTFIEEIQVNPME
jgi:hypothetical protein